MMDDLLEGARVQELAEALEEARMWAIEFKRIARGIWNDEWDGENDIDKLFDKWPTLPEWLKETE